MKEAVLCALLLVAACAGPDRADDMDALPSELASDGPRVTAEVTGGSLVAGGIGPADPARERAELRALATAARASGGMRALQRIVARFPDRVAILIDSLPAGALSGETLERELAAIFAADVGPRWRALAEAVAALRAQPSEQSAARAIVAAEGVGDPSLLAAALELRPADSAWPRDTWLVSEVDGWLHVGELELTRGEPLQALLHFQRGLNSARPGPEREELRLATARALYLLGERGSAALLAADVREGSEGSVRRRAASLEGAIAAERGELERATSLFAAALDGDESWSGAGRAAADRACALLALGRTDEGEAALARAHGILREQGDAAGEARLLANEIRYREATGAPQEAIALRATLEELAGREGLAAHLDAKVKL